MKRFLVRVVAGATAVVALSGCIKLDMDMKIKSNDKIDGSVIVGFSSQLIEMMGQKKADFIKEMQTSVKQSDLPKGAKTSTYDKNGFVGTQISFKDLPASDFRKATGAAAGAAASTSGGASGDDFKLVKKDGKWNFTGTMDLKGTGSKSGSPDLAALGSSVKAEVRIKLTFPGKITKHDKAGKVDGKSITWSPKMGEKINMQATAESK